MRIQNVPEQKLCASIENDNAHAMECESLKELQRYIGGAARLPIALCNLFSVPRKLRGLGRVFVLLLANEWKPSAFDHCAIDRHLGNIFAARHVVHDVEHDSLEH
jgi:hypothetical protein